MLSISNTCPISLRSALFVEQLFEIRIALSVAPHCATVGRTAHATSLTTAFNTDNATGCTTNYVTKLPVFGKHHRKTYASVRRRCRGWRLRRLFFTRRSNARHRKIFVSEKWFRRPSPETFRRPFGHVETPHTFSVRGTSSRRCDPGLHPVTSRGSSSPATPSSRPERSQVSEAAGRSNRHHRTPG